MRVCVAFRAGRLFVISRCASGSIFANPANWGMGIEAAMRLVFVDRLHLFLIQI